MNARVTIAVSVMACGLSACGAAKNTDDKQIRTVMRQALAVDEPASCPRLFTPAFVEQLAAITADDAATGGAKVDCGGDSADRPPSVETVAVTGATAESEIRPHDASLPFRTLKVGLVKTGARWRLDRLKGAKLDRTKMRGFLRDALASASQAGTVPAAVADCAARDLEQTSEREIVDAILTPTRHVFFAAVGVCSIRSQLSTSGLPPKLVACIVRGTHKEFTKGALARRIDAGHTSGLNYEGGRKLGRRLTIACLRKEAVTAQ